MLDGGILIFAKVTPHPGNSLAAHVAVGVGLRLDGWYGSDMAAQNDGGVR
jgi:hypothetical protein